MQRSMRNKKSISNCKLSQKMVFKLAERWIETIFVDRYFKIYRIGKIVFINKIALANKYFKLPIVR